MSFLDVPAQIWSEWGLRISVLLSLSANLLLSLLSGTRQRSASGWCSVLLWFGLWAAYQVAEIAAASAIGSLSLCGSDASAEEQVVIAFWAPFLLLHLGGPDTMTAYALEDNTMSLRKLAEMVFHIWGAFYVQYKYIYRLRSRSWTLLATASAIMLLVGAVRYAERSYALWKSNNIMEDDDEEG